MEGKIYNCNQCKDTGTYMGGYYGTKEVKCRNCNQIKIKTEMVKELKFDAVINLPEKVNQEYGVIYYSDKYTTSVHLCPCGCGNEVYINHDIDRRKGWVISVNEGRISINPSIGNTFKCKTHYYIINNLIKWV